MLWTPTQRGTLVLLLAILLAALSVKLLRDRTALPDPPPPAGQRADELASQLDPNTADWPALATLPNVGEALAKRIVAYREQVQRDHPGQAAFRTLDDLRHVKGIGPSTLDALKPHLLLQP